MEAIEFLKEKHRMCYSNSQDDNRCYRCPLSMSRNEYHIACDSLLENHPEEAVKIVEQWSVENHVVTNAQKFEEVFDLSGYRLITESADWWNAPYKEPEHEL